MLSKPFYTRIALLGIAMYLAIEVVIFILTVTLLPRSDLWYPLLVGSLALAGGAAIYFWHPWGLVVGVIGGLVGISFSLDGLTENLASPDSFFDFAYRPVIWLGGTILVLGGSATGLVQHFRHRTSRAGPAAVVRAAWGIIGIVGLISLVSAAMTVLGIDHVSARDREGATVVGISGWRFDTATISGHADGTTRLVFENNDGNIHTFTVDGLDIDQKLGPFGDTLVVLESPPPGRYTFRCRITGHDDMHGTLIIE